MKILRTIKSDYEMFENAKLECLVAIEHEDCKTIKAFFKKNKGKNPLPKETVPGFKFVNDETLDSLKIDFTKPMRFEIKDLSKV